MLINAETRRAIEKKARLFNATKDEIVERIKVNVKMAIEKLQAAERKLLDEVEIEFGENPFSSFLSSEEGHTEEEIRNILSKEIPSNFGPSEESFHSLLKEIESFKSWERKVNPFDLIPQNLKCTDVTWNTITVTWDELNLGSDSIYEIELRTSGAKDVYHTTQTRYTSTGLKPETDYHIRVCTVSTNGPKTMWCDSITVKTKKEPFTWKKCPEYARNETKYSVDEENPRIAKKIGGDCYCTIVDNVPIPLNQVVSWNIIILKSKNDGYGIIVGVAPSDIDQNIDRIYAKCGWYFGCYDSHLFSGPPHNYDNKTYGPRKRDGTYVHTGDSVGVVMNTAKGELSFVVNGVNYGVAYEGIPLDKPLVPCAILYYNGDSIGLAI